MRCVLFGVGCLTSGVCCWLCVVSCLLCVVRYVLCAVCCARFAVYCCVSSDVLRLRLSLAVWCFACFDVVPYARKLLFVARWLWLIG